MNFIEAVIAGQAHVDDIDDYVDEWHNSATTLKLHEWLGMSRDEYGTWVDDPSRLRSIVDHYRN